MRVNISIGEELNTWYELESKRIGVSKSALMCMTLETYRVQIEGMKAMKEGTRIYEEEKKSNARQERA